MCLYWWHGQGTPSDGRWQISAATRTGSRAWRRDFAASLRPNERAATSDPAVAPSMSGEICLSFPGGRAGKDGGQTRPNQVKPKNTNERPTEIAPTHEFQGFTATLARLCIRDGHRAPDPRCTAHFARHAPCFAAILSATEAANMILRIDDVIQAATFEKGPSQDEMEGMSDQMLDQV